MADHGSRASHAARLKPSAMPILGRYDNPYTAHEMHRSPPDRASSELVSVVSNDGGAGHAALWLPPGPKPRSVVTLMHPRADFLRHYTVPYLLDAGFAVWTQNSRWIGNDSTLVHEVLLLEVAAGMRELRRRGFERIILLGNSGGASLYSFYMAEALASERLARTAAGAPLDLSQVEMPAADEMVFLAAHPGEGDFLLDVIDPSVVDEADPTSCDAKLDMYATENGFAEPPADSSYEAEFRTRYRSAQRERVERLDRYAQDLIDARLAARKRIKSGSTDSTTIRQATSVKFFPIYRTEADLRYTDLSLDPSRRDYGSLMSRRPDITNYGPFGFARIITPDAWLSTWSGLSSKASIERNAPHIRVPTFHVAYRGDNAVFLSDFEKIFLAFASKTKESAIVEGDHYGHNVGGKFGGGVDGHAFAGRDAAAELIVDWLKRSG